MSISAAVKDMARDLPPGGSRSYVCPVCGGGKSREVSFSVTRLVTGGVAYQCHRASCPTQGVEAGFWGGPNPALPVFEPRMYPYDLKVPPSGHFIWNLLRLDTTFQTPELAARIGVCVRADDESEVVWDIVDYNWEHRGYTSRVYPEKKIKSWRERPGPFHGFFANGRVSDLWIVEDAVSAARIQLEGGNALALLGTHFSLEGQQELRAYLGLRASILKSPRVMIALDPDAYEQAKDLARALTFRIGCDTVAVPVTMDPKDMEPKELKALLNA